VISTERVADRAQVCAGVLMVWADRLVGRRDRLLNERLSFAGRARSLTRIPKFSQAAGQYHSSPYNQGGSGGLIQDPLADMPGTRVCTSPLNGAFKKKKRLFPMHNEHSARFYVPLVLPDMVGGLRLECR